MKYAVDFVINTMKELSGSEPVLFQRDGSLYVASPEGFGQVTYGLRASPEKIRPWENRGQPPEIAESENAIIGYHKKPVFSKDDKPFIKAISFGPDNKTFSLEEMTKTYHELAELPDDGKIRMVSHESSYHSHKNGYADEGMDVWVQEARVMERDRYLELIKEREDALIHAMESLGENRTSPSAIAIEEEISEITKELKKHDCIILTPLLKVSMPRKSYFDSETQKWDEKKILKQIYNYSTQGGILSFEDPCGEAPFALHVTTNSVDLQASNQEGFNSARGGLIDKLYEQISIVASNMPAAQDFIGKINDAYNKISTKWHNQTA